MIPQRNLSVLSNRLFREQGGRRIPETVLQRDYCLAWFLATLDTHPLREHLAFKGGTALRRCHFANYRFSEDNDFTLLQDMEFPAIQMSLEEIFAALRAASGIEFRLDRVDDVHENSHTFYLAYQGPLPAPDTVKVDITISERIVLPLENGTVLQSYAEFSDLPANRAVRVYSLGEILTEKIVALSDRARTDPTAPTRYRAEKNGPRACTVGAKRRRPTGFHDAIHRINVVFKSGMAEKEQLGRRMVMNILVTVCQRNVVMDMASARRVLARNRLVKIVFIN
jgi:predicted nucleotidyltransferase component of viral defense system